MKTLDHVKSTTNQSAESVGTNFDEASLKLARDKTLQVIIESSKQIKPGCSEKEGRKIVSEVQSQLGAPKSWHPPQIRFGENTLLPFGKLGLENPILKEDDIFFIDIGPIFDGYEGDVGRTFSIGNNSIMQACVNDVEQIWHEVHEHWRVNNISGVALYEIAKKVTQEKGWLLNLEKANGHRISDFPHAAKIRSSIDSLDYKPSPNRWILEIQIRHPRLPIGAFYEDLLK